MGPPQAPSGSQSQRLEGAAGRSFSRTCFFYCKKNKKQMVIMMGWASPQWLSWIRAHSREVASVVLIRSELQTKSPVIIINLEHGPEVGEY